MDWFEELMLVISKPFGHFSGCVVIATHMHTHTHTELQMDVIDCVSFSHLKIGRSVWKVLSRWSGHCIHPTLKMVSSTHVPDFVHLVNNFPITCPLILAAVEKFTVVGQLLACIRRRLEQEPEHSDDICTALRNHPIIPLSDGQFVTLVDHEVFFPPGQRSDSGWCQDDKKTSKIFFEISLWYTDLLMWGKVTQQ